VLGIKGILRGALERSPFDYPMADFMSFRGSYALFGETVVDLEGSNCEVHDLIEMDLLVRDRSK
jgi:hypothetical protein